MRAGKSMLKQGNGIREGPGRKEVGCFGEGRAGPSTCVFPLCTGPRLKSRCCSSRPYLHSPAYLLFAIPAYVSTLPPEICPSSSDICFSVRLPETMSIMSAFPKMSLFHFFFSQHISQQLYWHIILCRKVHLCKVCRQ